MVHPSHKQSEGVKSKLGQKVDFLSHCHISTSGFAAAVSETAVFASFLPV